MRMYTHSLHYYRFELSYHQHRYSDGMLEQMEHLQTGFPRRPSHNKLSLGGSS